MTAEGTVRKIESLDCNAEYSTFNIILYVRGNIYNQRFPTGTFIEKNKEESLTTFLFVSNYAKSPNILVEDQSLISLVAKEEEESL